MSIFNGFNDVQMVRGYDRPTDHAMDYGDVGDYGDADSSGGIVLPAPKKADAKMFALGVLAGILAVKWLKF